MEAVIFWSDCDLKYDLVRESQGFFSCLAAGNPARDGQCMKRPVAHSLNSTWFWIELPENCCEPLKFIMKYLSIQFCERPGHGRPFHALDGCHGALDIHDSILKCISMNKKLSIEENFILMIEKFCIIFFLFKFHFSQIALAQDQVFCW